MANLTAVNPKGEKNAILSFDDGTTAWTPDIELANKLQIGQPLPSDWTAKDGPYGPQVFPPRPKGQGAPAAFRNTKEGQAIEQERMDRRTALMQAVAVRVVDGPSSDQVMTTAQRFYLWLRETSATQNKGGTVMVVDALGEGPQVRGKAPARTEEGEEAGGTGKASPASDACAHKNQTNLRPDGVELPLGRLRCEDCGVSWKAGE